MKNRISLQRLQKATTAFFLCDVQEKFRPAIPLFGAIVENISKLLCTAKIFEIPLFVTEQYPEKLGSTVKELSTEGACIVQPKTVFSMMSGPFKERVDEVFAGKLQNVVLFGIETHVCIEQTAMDLLNDEINVWLVADCVASRLNQDRDLAVERLRDMGCIITTSESIIFNLLCSKDNPHFKDLANIVRKPSADVQLWQTTKTKS